MNALGALRPVRLCAGRRVAGPGPRVRSSRGSTRTRLSRLHVKAGAGDPRAGQLRRGRSRPPRAARRVAARGTAGQGRPRGVRRSDAAPAAGAILALVLGRRSSPKGNARDADRQALTFDDVGDAGGWPVLYFHGGGDSRLTRHPDDGIAASLGVRLIAVERSGPPSPGAPSSRGRATSRRSPTTSASTGSRSSAGRRAGPTPSRSRAVLDGRVARVVLVGSMPLPDRTAALARDVRLSLRAATLAPRFLGPSRSMGKAGDPAHRQSRDRRGLCPRSRRVVPSGRPLAGPRAGRPRPALGLWRRRHLRAGHALVGRERRGLPALDRAGLRSPPACCNPEAGRGHPSASLRALAGHPRRRRSSIVSRLSVRFSQKDVTPWQHSPPFSKRF